MSVVLTSSHHRAWSRFNFQLSFAHPRLESVNALVEERCAKVDHWQNSSQRHRWLATALLDIEPHLRKLMGYRHLPQLRAALKRELKIDTKPLTKEAA